MPDHDLPMRKQLQSQSNPLQFGPGRSVHVTFALLVDGEETRRMCGKRSRGPCKALDLMTWNRPGSLEFLLEQAVAHLLEHQMGFHAPEALLLFGDQGALL